MYGAVRTGKSIAAAFALGRKMLTEPGTYLLAGYSAASVWSVQAKILRAVAQRVGAHYGTRRSMRPAVLFGQSEARVVGLSKAGSQDAVMGDTMHGAWYDEVSRMDRAAFDESLSRLSRHGAMAIMTTNPTAPGSWLADYVLKEADLRRAWTRRLAIEDNPRLPDEYVAYLRGIYGGIPHLRARYIEGRFAASVGLIYQDIGMVPTMNKSGPMALAVDAGPAGVTAAVYAWLQPDKETWVIGDEYRWDATRQGQIGEAAHARNILQRHGEPWLCVVDPAASNMRYELVRVGIWASSGDNDVLEGLMHTDGALRRRRLVLLEGAVPHLERELGTLSWDEDASEKGLDKPIDGDDHEADCMRYLARATIPRWEFTTYGR